MAFEGGMGGAWMAPKTQLGTGLVIPVAQRLPAPPALPGERLGVVPVHPEVEKQSRNKGLSLLERRGCKTPN